LSMRLTGGKDGEGQNKENCDSCTNAL